MRERVLCTQGALTASVLDGRDEQRDAIEQGLEATGVPLPVAHRLAWARATSPSRSLFVVIRDRASVHRGAFAVAVARSRALPGHVVLRVERLGPGLSDAVRGIALLALARLAHEEPRVLRVYAELFERDATRRASFEEAAASLGFRAARAPRSYARTIALDLAPAESELLRSFSTIVRRNITKVEQGKLPLVVRPIVETALVPRMTQLLSDVYARTGGALEMQDLTLPIVLSREAPRLSRIVGLFRTDCDGPDSLLGFAWGKMQGDCASYDTGAAGRFDGGSVGVAYPLMWDLIRWARREGATWFDLGGITDGNHGSDDRLGGISDFKRKFGGETVTVGVDIELEPSAARVYVAEAVRAGVRLATRVVEPLRARRTAKQPVEVIA